MHKCKLNSQGRGWVCRRPITHACFIDHTSVVFLVYSRYSGYSPVLPCPVLSRPTLSCPAMSCHAMSCPALPCHALPCSSADMANRLDFCNSLYLGIGDQGFTGQVCESLDCGGQTHPWSSEIRPYTSGSSCSSCQWRIQRGHWVMPLPAKKKKSFHQKKK